MIWIQNGFIDIIDDSDIPNDFYMDSDTFRPLTGSVDLHSGPKISVTGVKRGQNGQKLPISQQITFKSSNIHRYVNS